MLISWLLSGLCLVSSGVALDGEELTVGQLKAKVSELEEENTRNRALLKGISRLANEKRDVIHKLTSLEENFEKINKEHYECLTEVHRLVAKLNGREQKASITNCISEKAELKKKLQELDNDNELLKKDKNKYMIERDKEKTRADRNLAKAERWFNRFKEYPELKAAKRNLTADNEKLTRRLKVCNKKLKQAKQDLEKKEDSPDDIKLCESESKILREQNAKMLNQIDDLEGCQARLKKVTSDSLSAQNMDKKLQGCEKYSSEVRESFDTCVDDWRMVMDQKENCINSLNEAHAEIASLKEKYDKATSEASGTISKIEKLEKKLKSCNTAKEKAHDRFNKMQETWLNKRNSRRDTTRVRKPTDNHCKSKERSEEDKEAIQKLYQESKMSGTKYVKQELEKCMNHLAFRQSAKTSCESQLNKINAKSVELTTARDKCKDRLVVSSEQLDKCYSKKNILDESTNKCIAKHENLDVSSMNCYDDNRILRQRINDIKTGKSMDGNPHMGNEKPGNEDVKPKRWKPKKPLKSETGEELTTEKEEPRDEKQGQEAVETSNKATFDDTHATQAEAGSDKEKTGTEHTKTKTLLQDELDTCRKNLVKMELEEKECDQELKYAHQNAVFHMDERNGCTHQCDITERKIKECEKELEELEYTSGECEREVAKKASILKRCEKLNSQLRETFDKVVADVKKLKQTDATNETKHQKDSEIKTKKPTTRDATRSKGTEKQKNIKPVKQKKKQKQKQKGEKPNLYESLPNNDIDKCTSVEECKRLLEMYIKQTGKYVQKLKARDEIIQKSMNRTAKMRQKMHDRGTEIREGKIALEKAKETEKEKEKKIEQLKKEKRSLELSLAARKEDLSDCKEAKHAFAQQVLRCGDEVDGLRKIAEDHENLKKNSKKEASEIRKVKEELEFKNMNIQKQIRKVDRKVKLYEEKKAKCMKLEEEGKENAEKLKEFRKLKADMFYAQEELREMYAKGEVFKANEKKILKQLKNCNKDLKEARIELDKKVQLEKAEAEALEDKTPSHTLKEDTSKELEECKETKKAFAAQVSRCAKEVDKLRDANNVGKESVCDCGDKDDQISNLRDILKMTELADTTEALDKATMGTPDGELRNKLKKYQEENEKLEGKIESLLKTESALRYQFDSVDSTDNPSCESLQEELDVCQNDLAETAGREGQYRQKMIEAHQMLSEYRRSTGINNQEMINTLTNEKTQLQEELDNIKDQLDSCLTKREAAECGGTVREDYENCHDELEICQNDQSEISDMLDKCYDHFEHLQKMLRLERGRTCVEEKKEAKEMLQEKIKAKDELEVVKGQLNACAEQKAKVDDLEKEVARYKEERDDFAKDYQKCLNKEGLTDSNFKSCNRERTEMRKENLQGNIGKDEL